MLDVLNLSDSLMIVERAIGGVEARRIILKELLEGPKTGYELRDALAKELGVSVDNISDAKLYFNLQALENSGLINRYREWKSKYAEIIPSMVQAVRRYLNVSAPVLCLSSLDSEPLLVREVGRRLREQSGIDPDLYVFIAENEMRTRVGGKPDNAEIIWVPEYAMYDFKRMYEVTKNIVEREIGRKEIIMDVTDGTRISAVALQQLAWEYGLRVFYLKGKKDDARKVVWIRE